MASRPVAASLPSLPVPAAAPLWQAALIGGAVLAAAGVMWIGQHDDAARLRRAGDPELLVILRLMAGIKAAAAIGMLALAEWRLRRPAPATLSAAMVGAGMMMVSGPALIWTMATIGGGALAFYAGLLTLGALLWSDRGEMLAALGVPGARPRG